MNFKVDINTPVCYRHGKLIIEVLHSKEFREAVIKDPKHENEIFQKMMEEKTKERYLEEN